MVRSKTTKPTKLDTGRPEGIKKKRRSRPGTVAKREVKKQQRSFNLLFPKSTFARLVREITYDINPDIERFNGEAFLVLQEAAEKRLITIFDSSMRNMVHAKRETLMPSDMDLALRNERIMNGQHVPLTEDEAAQYIKKQLKKTREKKVKKVKQKKN